MSPLTSPRLLAALALLLVTTWVAFSCSSSPSKVAQSEETLEHWYATVGETIDDSQRASRVKALGKQWIDLTHSIRTEVEDLNAQVIALNADYTATAADLEALVDAFVENRNPKFEQYQGLLFAIRGEVSADEWDALID